MVLILTSPAILCSGNSAGSAHKKKRKEKRQGRCEVKWWELCKTYLNSQIKSCLGLISKHSGLKPWQKTLSKTTGEVRITHAFTFFLQIFFFLPKLLQGFELLTLWAQTCLPNLYGRKCRSENKVTKRSLISKTTRKQTKRNARSSKLLRPVMLFSPLAMVSSSLLLSRS